MTYFFRGAMWMRIVFLLTTFILALTIVACVPSAPSSGQRSILNVAATAVPHAEILEVVKPILAEQGITLNVRIFSDYVQPNDLVVQGQMDVNYFQTEPYLEAYNRDRGTALVTLAAVHIEPFAAYSRRYASLDVLPDGAEVVIPNDPSNNSRALILLHQNGLIRLQDPANALSTLHDIVDNPKQLNFRELDAAMLPRVLDQVDLALINTNYALDAGLNPRADALAIEGKDSPYVNFLVGLADKRNDARVQALIRALTSEPVREYIYATYHDAVVPAF